MQMVFVIHCPYLYMKSKITSSNLLVIVQKILDHIRPIEKVTKPSIVITRSNTCVYMIINKILVRQSCLARIRTRDYSDPTATVLLTGDTLRLFHQQCTDTLMLEFLGVTRVNGCSSTIHVLINLGSVSILHPIF